MAIARMYQAEGVVARDRKRRQVRQSLAAAARRRALLFEPLEDRRVMAAAVWRNPVDSLDVNADSYIVPSDVLELINDLNSRGSRALAGKKVAAMPYLDVDGDGFVAPIDALKIINYLNSGVNGNGRRLLTETGRLASEVTVTIGLGQLAGSRKYQVQLTPTFDTTSHNAALEDTLAVYLVNPDQPTQTLLDRGDQGTTLFSLSGGKAESAPGLVRWDGSVLEIDVTSLEEHDTGLLKFQLLSSDQDSGSRVVIAPLTSVVDEDAGVNPRIESASTPALVDASAADLSQLAPAGDVRAEFENVRFDPASGRYSAEMLLRNDGASLRRQIAVAFPGLPNGVTLRNPSGTTGAGAPYLNLKPAIPRGGLRTGASSERVLVEFDDPAQAVITLLPQVWGAPNRAPVLNAIPAQTTTPGDVLRIPLTATDADGDRVTFAIDGDASLPTGELSGSTLLFRPTPDDLGSYQFDVIASDGAVEVRRQVALNIVADPVTTTRISGQVLRVNGVPLANMPVEIGGVSGFTLADGSFQLDLGSGPVVSDTLKIRGERFGGSPAGVYPYIAEKLPLMLWHEVYRGFNNVIDRPIYLPELDVAGGSTVDPLRDTAVRQEIAPGESAEVLVAAGTLMNQQGTPFTGVLSITEVPPGLTPAALPDGLSPDLVVTIQPGEMVFARPAPLSLPNRSGWGPGVVMDLWSINPVTGEFEDVGDAQVSTDGQTIETISGGVRNSSWHFASPPGASSPGRGRSRTGESGCNACEFSSEASSRVEQFSGAIIESHDLATYQSQGVARGVRLVYDSLRADPRPIIHFGAEDMASADELFPYLTDALRYAARFTIDRGSFHYVVPGTPVKSSGATLFTGLEDDFHFWRLPEQAGPADAALQVDLRNQPTGVYTYDVESGVYFMRPPGTCEGLCVPPPPQFVGTATRYSSPLVVVNDIASPLGAGWGIAGVQRLIEEADRTVLIVDGDGSELVFRYDSQQAAYVAPPGDFSTLERLVDGRFRRTSPDRTVYQFDAAGRLVSVTDRNHNATRYGYDGDGRLVSITDPVDLVTTLSYANGLLSSITDPANRQTRFEHDAAGDLTRVIDPDNSTRTWGYDADHHIISEVDQLGRRETTEYGTHGRAIGGVHKDGSTYVIRAPQAQAVAKPDSTIGLDPKARMVSLDEQVEAISLDPNGNVMTAEIDPAGQVVARRDSLGGMASTQRGEGNLPVATTNARGFARTNSFDERGNLLTSRDSLSLRVGDAPGSIGVLAGDLRYFGEKAHYSFAGRAGESVYLDTIQGTNATWLRRAEDAAHSSVGLGLLPADGNYMLDVGAFSTDTLGPYVAKLWSLNQAPTLPLGTTTGNGTAGEDLVYRVALQRDQRLRIVDAERFAYRPWSLRGLDGSYSAFITDDSNKSYEFTAPADAEYAVIRERPTASTLSNEPYGFTVSIHTPDPSVAKSGFDTIRSGTLAPLEERTFRFTAPVGTMLYVDRLFIADPNRDFANLTLRDSNGELIEVFGNSPSENLLRLNDSDEFQLVVTNWSSVGETDFSFRLLDAADVPPVEIGDLLEGTLTGGNARIVRLRGAPGQRVITRSVVGADLPAYLATNKVVVLDEAGEHLTVLDSANASEDYRWRSLDVRLAEPLTLDQDVRSRFVVGDDLHYYRFKAAPGALMFLAELDSNITQYEVFDESGKQWDSVFSGGGFTLLSMSQTPEEPREFILSAIMDDPIYLPHDYGFQLHRQHESTQEIIVGQTVAGELDWVEVDRHEFEGRAGQWLYIDARRHEESQDFSFGATLTGPDNGALSTFSRSLDVGPLQLSAAGVYRMDLQSAPLNAQSTLHQDYEYRVFDMGETPLATFLSPMERPLRNGAAVEIYRYAAASGQRVTFTQSAPATTSLRVYTPRGELLRDTGADESLTMTFQESATYFLIVSGRDPSVATPVASRWTISDATEPSVTPSGFGAIYDGFAHDDELVATFAGNAGTRVVFAAGEETRYSQVGLKIVGPTGELVASLGPTAFHLFMLPSSGAYAIRAEGINLSAGSTDRYRFRLEQVEDLPSLALDVEQRVSIDVDADLNELFLVPGAGRQVWLDVVPPDSFNEAYGYHQPHMTALAYDATLRDGSNPYRADAENHPFTTPAVGPLVLRALTQLNDDSFVRIVDLANVAYLANGSESTGVVAHSHEDKLWRITASAGEKRRFQLDSPNYSLFNLNDSQDYLSLQFGNSPSEVAPGVFAYETVAEFKRSGEYLLARRGTFGQSLEFSARMDAFSEQTFPLTAATLSRTEYAYDPTFNQLTRISDEQRRQTLFDVDPATGNARSITRVVGAIGGGDDSTTSFTYTASGQIDTVTDPLGRVTDYDYDSRGNLVRVVAAKGTAMEAAASYELDAAGNISAVIDANGSRTTFEYDALNRRTKLTAPDPDGAGPLPAPVSTWTHDAAGNITTTTDGAGHVTTQVHDARDRVISVADATNQVTRFTYDRNGNLVALTDPSGRVTRMQYDARNRMIASIDAAGLASHFRYDLDGNLLSVADAAGNVTRYEYDARGRRVADIDPFGNASTFVYNGMNELVTKTDRLGRVTRFEFDDLGRLTRESWWDASGAAVNTLQSTYDAADRLVRIHDDASDLRMTLDDLNRATRIETGGVAGSPTAILEAAYDAVGNRLILTDTIQGSLGARSTYSYDAANRLISETQAAAPGATNPTAEKRVDFNFNAHGQPTRIARHRDLAGAQTVAVSSFTYDSLNRLTEIAHRNAASAGLATFGFTYDVASRLARVTDTDGATNYAYDTRGQLTAANHADPSNPDESYQYDAAGNRATSHLHGAGYSTSDGNRLAADGTHAFEYDAEGNLVRQTTIVGGAVREFAWDHRNRLISVTDRPSAVGAPTQVAEYAYDAANRRIAKTVGGASTHFVYDGGNVLVELTDPDASGPASATESMRYMHGPAVDQVFAQEDAAGAVEWHLSDHLGTVRDLVDETGAIVNHLKYDSFGNVVSQTAPARDTRFRFTGREFDAETGLHYFRARYYASETGRFLSEDPIGFAGGGLNLYAYVGNQPTEYRDPTGHNALLAATGAAVGYTTGYLANAAGQAAMNFSMEGRNWSSPSDVADALAIAISTVDVDQALTSGLIGAGTGALATNKGLSTAGALALAAASNLVQYVATTDRCKQNLADALFSLATGAIGGWIGGKVARAAPKFNVDAAYVDSSGFVRLAPKVSPQSQRIFQQLNREAENAANASMGNIARAQAGAVAGAVPSPFREGGWLEGVVPDPWGPSSGGCDCQ